jgi:hypothetical protein
VIENSVVAFSPPGETLPNVVPRGPWLKAHEGVGEAILFDVVLGGKVVSLRLSLLSDQLGEFVSLVHVMRDRAEIVKELAEKVPAAFALEYLRSEQFITDLLDGFLEQETLVRGRNVAQALGGRSVGPVGGVRRG